MMKLQTPANCIHRQGVAAFHGDVTNKRDESGYHEELDGKNGRWNINLRGNKKIIRIWMEYGLKILLKRLYF